jgi:polynucleotide 5'-hydroxyl-kinase GRC3/NOL9
MFFQGGRRLQQTVDSNNTLLVDGPASVRLVSGKVEVFGAQIKEFKRILVREGKRLPFFVREKTVLDISLGANAAIDEVAGRSTIPLSWNKPLDAILSAQKKPMVILILGKIDSGKSSYCTYLVNKIVNVKSRVAVLDGDLGQSDIGPSGTVGFALTSKPLTELYDLKLENAFFVGVTSPIKAISKTIEGLAAMKAQILERPVDFIVVNTDGWVAGDIAVRYKIALIKELKPDLIVGLPQSDELEMLIANIEETQIILVEPSSSLSQRSPEKRKSLREMTYARYLKDAKMVNYPISQLTIEPKNAIPKSQEPEKGLLVGLYGLKNQFLGIGVLREINYVRKALKVQTSVSAKPNRLFIGKVVLDMKLQEIQD